MLVQRKKILVLLIILILCIFTVLVVSKIIKNRNVYILDEMEAPEASDYFDPSQVKRVEIRNDYILVQKCVNKYFKHYSDTEYTNKIIADDYLKLYSVSLQKNDEESISLESSEISINNMYVTEIGLGVYFYYVDGDMVNVENLEKQEFEIGVIIDNANRTFGVIPQKYLEKMGFSGLNENSNVTFKEINSIKNKETNTFIASFVNEETYMADYLFPDFINKCLLNADIAYEFLDDEYKERRFGNIDGFKQFLDKNIEIYETINPQNRKTPDDFEDYDEYLSYFHMYKPLKVVSTGMKNMGDYIQYVVVDNLNNTYIFRETGTMKYKVILDTYTLELPEFVEEYKKADIKTKVALNIAKVVEALNNEDYKYVYSKLADSFKENYFTTLESFEEYAKDVIGTGNEAEYNSFLETANYCTFDITLKRRSFELTKTIIMQLQDGTDFVMSFNID